MDRDLWSRRTNTNKLSLSTPSSGHGDRNSSFSKRFGGDSSSHGGKNPFNTVTTPGSGLASPGGANFGLGTGAFSAFGSTTKTPKSPGNPFEAVKGAAEKPAPDGPNGSASKATGGDNKSGVKDGKNGGQPSESILRNPWCFWFRPSIPKNVSIPYDETVHGLAEVATAEQFWAVYRHLARPSTLQPVSDYHLFKKGVRPIWEDDENRKGGKWLVRLKKGVADRYWEALMLALIGDQFHDAGVEICGAVVSVRNGEDIISIWTASKEGKMIRIRQVLKMKPWNECAAKMLLANQCFSYRDTFRKILQLPANTKIDWKVHEESIQQRITIEESRKEKANQHRQGKPQTQRQNQHQGNESSTVQAS